MTSSGSYNFGVTTEAIDVITEAYERCGREASELAANDLISARRSLEFMFAGWSNRQINLWTVELQVINLVPGQEQYVLDSNIVFIAQAFTRTQSSGGQNVDLIIDGISRAEYAALPRKDQTANRPTQFYFERTQPPSIYPWPVLGTNYSAQLMLYVARMQQDVGKLTNTLDAPNRWMDAIAAGLAARLATKWSPDRKADLAMEADAALALAMAEDRERVPLSIAPDVIGPGWGYS